MTLLHEFARVSRKNRCPVCDRPDWCLVSRDDPASPSKVICTRVESKFRWGEAGWLHRLRDDGGAWKSRPRTFTVGVRSQPSTQFADLFARSLEPRRPESLAALARSLEVTPEILDRLEVGFLTQAALEASGTHVRSAAATFPMRNADDTIIGLRLRIPGRKFAVNGSKNGLFIPRGLPLNLTRLLIAEGESDAAALLDLDFDVVGRPGCNNSTHLVIGFAKRRSPSEIVIVADNDDQGHRGARDLGMQLRVHFQRVVVIKPPDPIKDARAWKIAGATHETVEAAIVAALEIQLSISMRPGGA
jgi:hypothetical protein